MIDAAAPSIDLNGRGWSLTPDAFVGSVLGCPALRLEVTEVADWPSLDRAIVGAGRVFIDVKVAASAASTVGRLEGAGFNVVDTNVTLALKEPSDARPAVGSEAVVRPARPDDEAAVRSIAAQTENSRFHLDPRIDDDVASRMRVEWVGNYFRGQRGDRLLVAENRGKVAGFLLTIERPGALIDLIAVGPDHRRRGLARQLILDSIGMQLKPCTISVGTQVSNVASLRLYESLGFRITGASYVLHRHGGSE